MTTLYQDPGCHGEYGLGQMGRICRASDLIGHHTDHGALAG
jgi:hypothetical protein